MAAGDFCTAQEVKDYLGSSDKSGDYELIGGMVTGISAFLEQQMSRKILSATYSDSLHGTGGPMLFLPKGPVSAVSSVAIDGQTVASGEYRFDRACLYIVSCRRVFARGFRNVDVTWTAGFDVVPADIKQATIELCAYAFRERKRIGLVSEAQAQMTTAYSQLAVPRRVQAVIQNRQWVVPAT